MIHIFLSGCVALGFALAFNAPRHALIWTFIAACLGFGTKTFLLTWTGIELSTLGGSVVIGIVGLIGAKRLNIPVPVITISAAIIMIPGIHAYQAIVGVVRFGMAPIPDLTLLAFALQNGIKTLLILMALATGIALPSLLLRRYKHRML